MKGHLDKDIRTKLAEKHACFVLITCDKPLEDGNMNVEMSFEGDPLLASLLLQGAQSRFEMSQMEADIKNMN